MWKFYLSLYIAKITKFLIDFFKIGSGFTWPGHVVLKLFPNILNNTKFKFSYGFILISGTNGKTTTSKLLTHILEESGLRVISNRTGANLLNGIASEIILSFDLLGRNNSDICVFEVDENNLSLLLNYVSPNVIVLLNLSRDQLDRYGEVDLILEKWIASIKNVSADTEIVLDSTQEYFKDISKAFSGEITPFDESTDYLKHTKLVGKFNAKNVNAAVFTSILIGIDEELIKKSLQTFSYAYGRGEIVTYLEKDYKIILAKNPASFNNNLTSIIDNSIQGSAVLIVLNDNIPDGRDISWIYDIEPHLLFTAFFNKEIYVSGSRYLDMSIRLTYAGLKIKNENIDRDISFIIKKIQQFNDIKNIIVLPNYSAMLEVRKILVGRKIL